MKLNSKAGISLIVLIITIIVVIILAAVVVLTLSKNNPIESAKEATFKEDVKTFQDELSMYISKEYVAKAGARDEKITTSNFDKIHRYISSFNLKYQGKFVIKNDELVYNEDKLNEKELKYVNDLNLKLNTKTSAELIDDNPIDYYGKTVNYSSNGVNNWKIYYSDGDNIYLISSEYIDLEKLPAKNGKKPENGNTNYEKAAPLLGVLNEYNGSSDIVDEKIKELNYDYFINKKYKSTSNAIKAVAYLLDTKIWNIFAEGDGAEYAVGGPSKELLLKSYSKKYNVDFRARARSSTGYEISRDGGKNWATAYGSMLEMDPLYVRASNSGANGMWLSSPGNGSSTVGAVGWYGNVIVRYRLY